MTDTNKQSAVAFKELWRDYAATEGECFDGMGFARYLFDRMTSDCDALAARLGGRMFIGAFISDGRLYATVMRRNGNGGVTVLAHTDLEVDLIEKRECFATMAPAADRHPLTDEQITEEFEGMLGVLELALNEDAYLSALAWFRRGAKLARSCDN